MVFSNKKFHIYAFTFCHYDIDKTEKKFYNKDVSMVVTFTEDQGTGSGINHREVQFDDTVLEKKDYKGQSGAITYKDVASTIISTTEFNKNKIRGLICTVVSFFYL